MQPVFHYQILNEEDMMMAKKSIKLDKIKNSKHVIGFSFLCLLFLSAAACQSLQLESVWKDSEIQIDGKSDDWVGRMMFMDNPNVSLGIQNDEHFLYICMIAEDPSIRNRINISGMILWFDPAGGKKKNLGIKFPVGRGDLQMDPRERMTMDQERDPARMEQRFQPNLDEMEILQAGQKEPLRLFLDNLKGIELCLNSASGLLIYEAKIPLLDSPDFPFTIGAQDKLLIGVGLEVPKMDISQRPGNMGGRGGMGGGMGGRGGAGGGMGGAGGMGGSMGGRGGPGGAVGMQQGVKIWATVQLADITETKQN